MVNVFLQFDFWSVRLAQLTIQCGQVGALKIHSSA